MNICPDLVVCLKRDLQCLRPEDPHRGRVAIYRPFGELRRAKIVLSPVWCSRPTTGVPLAHATMNFVGLDLTASDRWHQTTTTTRPEASLVLIYRPNVAGMKGRVDLVQPVNRTPDLWCGSTIHYHSTLFGEK
ncbi:hypothetical protein TNCV_5110291 [Trichonephila clavipes]|nr:hypothetical protein TNCV_5110291 [Trichonephila clavipes]